MDAVKAKTLGKILVIVCVAGIGLTGCERGQMESFFKTGKWRFLSPDKPVAQPDQTLVMPIVGNYNALDAGDGPYPNAVRPNDADLVYQDTDYLIGVTDILDISILDLYAEGLETLLRREVTESGYIDLPQLKDRIKAEGLTQYELTAKIKKAYIEEGILREPVVASVTVVTRRQQTFSVTGACGRPGTYQFVRPDMRLWDALALAGGVTQPNIDYIYVIRQAPPTPSSKADVEMSGHSSRPAEQVRLPHHRRTPPKRRSDLEAIDALMTGSGPEASDTEMVSSFAETGDADAIIIQPAPAADTAANGESNGQQAEGRWEYRDGKWVRVGEEPAPPVISTEPAEDPMEEPVDEVVEEPTIPAAEPEPAEPEVAAPLEAAPAAPEMAAEPVEPAAPREPADVQDQADPFGWASVNGNDLVRVIAINRDKLEQGGYRENVVIRENDVIYIPPLEVGEFYMYGEINRPGVYSLTGRQVTIKMAIAAAGGLGPMAWPENSVLVRRVGDDQEQMIPINAERIIRGEDPDMLLKPDDVIMVGTHASATFLAVLRNSFRMTYGFGFIYDRNFADPLLVTPRSNRFSRL
jgi:protein involved in polysaccharide export with SLBB domain